MRILVVSDVHSNLEALQAVIADAGAEAAFDAVWCLGDTVGYGPDPNACIALLRSYECVAVAGNHDRAAAGLMGSDGFNPVAAEAASWTAQALGDAECEWLSGLPEVATQHDFTLVHGSLNDPMWEYLVTAELAKGHLLLQATPYGLVGHSHLPLIFRHADVWVVGGALRHGSAVHLDGSRFVANPGGVGQPRDGDPRTAYAVLDTDTNRIDFRRIEYDIAATQAKIVAAGLPALLAKRLSQGR